MMVIMNLYCTENELVDGFPEDCMASITGDPFLYFEDVVHKIANNPHVAYMEVIVMGDTMESRIWNVQTKEVVDLIENEDDFLKFVFDEGFSDV